MLARPVTRRASKCSPSTIGLPRERHVEHLLTPDERLAIQGFEGLQHHLTENLKHNYPLWLRNPTLRSRADLRSLQVSPSPTLRRTCTAHPRISLSNPVS